MARSDFPIYASHDDASCFNCGGDWRGSAYPHASGYPKGRGAWVQHCDKCNYRTYYDLKREERHMKPPYYVDLNPDYPSRYAKRWLVFYKWDTNPARRTQEQFVTRKAAERCAQKLNDQERDDLYPAW